jgi:hypothetical protein
MANKKTALQRAVLALKKRQWLYEGIDDEKASIIEECILDIENYLDVERKHIIDAYIEGCGDWFLHERTDNKRAKEYYNETFKQQDNEQ